MRDGLYKDSPLSMAWQNARCSVLNDADWRDGGFIHLCRAIVTDLRKQLRGGGLRRLAQWLASPQRDLFQGASSMWDCCNKESPTSLEEKVLRVVDYQNGGQVREEDLVMALDSVIQEFVQARLREATTEQQVHEPRAAPLVIRRMRDLLKLVPIRHYAEQIIAGEMPALLPIKGTGPDMDGDLT